MNHRSSFVDKNIYRKELKFMKISIATLFDQEIVHTLLKKYEK